MTPPARILRLTCLLLFLACLIPSGAQAQQAGPLVLVLDADATVSPAMQEYIRRGIRTAEARSAELLVIQLNTPGGMIQTTVDIVSDLRASRVPVVVYVAPRGALAASAGTLITLAGHAAAMAPETVIGAASPVDAQGQDLTETIKAKEMETLQALVRAITTRRSPEAVQLAQDTIENARAVSADEALSSGLVDYIANDLADLLRQLDGVTLSLADGDHTLHTAGARTEDLPKSFIEQLLEILIDPNFVFLLVTIGVQAILIELSSPGGWVAGFIGVVCLGLAAYGLGVLPVNWFGLLFLLISFVLFILDIKAPTHGALTAAGIGTFIVGALVLFNSPGVPQFQRVSIPLVVSTAVIMGVFFFTIVGFGIRALHAPPRMGQETLPGKTGVARSDIDPSGQVQAEGELWTAELAEGAGPIRAGERVEIVEIKGLRLKVRSRN